MCFLMLIKSCCLLSWCGHTLLALQAVMNMRICLEDCYEELQQELSEMNCGWQDFMWAVQVGC